MKIPINADATSPAEFVSGPLSSRALNPAEFADSIGYAQRTDSIGQRNLMD
jgi:hypothetical protein